MIFILYFDHTPGVEPATYSLPIHLQQSVATYYGEWDRCLEKEREGERERRMVVISTPVVRLYLQVTYLCAIIFLVYFSCVDMNPILHHLIHHLQVHRDVTSTLHL